jgi:hypothetical protein
MSTRAIPFAYHRRPLARAGVRHLGDGPQVMTPGDPSSDAVEYQTEVDEGILGPDGMPAKSNLGRPWIFQPTNWETIHQATYALLPAIGSTVTILSYPIPPGRNAVIGKIANNFVGGGWVEGTGDVVWRVLVDGTPPPGANSYDNIVNSLGSPAAPTGQVLGSLFRVFENSVLTLVAFNNPAGPNGGVVVAGQRVGACLMGWNYPVAEEENEVWI